MPLGMEGGRILALGPTYQNNIMGSVRRARGLSDIAPQYVAKSGLCNATELESSRGGSIRIQHVTGVSNASEGRSRFPKLDECAHFHYEHVEIGPIQVSIVDDDDLKPLSNEQEEGKWWSLSVTSQSKTWLIRRSYDNFRMLDQQLHRCIYDRKFSGLVELPAECIEEQENIHKLLSDYVARFSTIAGSLINCGPVLNWLELDNRGHRLLVPDTDNCPINTPAVAAAYSVKRYTAQAPDEISFEVGDMISVIDMPPPEESIWWRGKRGFQVGFFPCECVAVIGDKVPRNLHISTHNSQPSKPVLRKHGKLIAFFRSFILSRPSRRRLKQSGILKERVFGCDLGEHLLNSGHEIPMVLKCCAEFIETHGLVDGIYRLSGVTSNIQKLRNAFDEDRVPALYEDEAILQDIHSVASLLKMYFRELPNPLCTYQLYHQFVGAVQNVDGNDTRLLRMRDAVQKLPPPHYRTLEYLMRHLARVAEKGHETGMTPRNVAIVWAPNLLRCKELEVGGVAALQGVGVQAVVTEFLVCYTDLIFCDRLPSISLPPIQVNSKKSRPKSLAISTPTKLLSLEEARTRALLQAAGKAEQDYIEVGGGPASLPAKYHTVIELPVGSRKRPGSKRSPLGWKLLFGKSGRNSQARKEAQRKASTPSDLGLHTEKAVTESDIAQNRRRLRPAKSVESLNSSRNSATLDIIEPLQGGLSSPDETIGPMMLRNVDVKSNGHNRSVSHESYFDQLQDQQEEERFESNLDISEIQVNFDLEESEMRIFSEDETLISNGSGSLISNSSPRILPGSKFHKSLASGVAKRLSYPKLARGEDSLSSSQSADPSPKKQKTSEGLAKRSRLEEQLASSAGELQFIDSVSPDQVLVQAEVHLIQSPSPVSSISQISSSILPPSSPILPHIPHLTRPLSQTIASSNNNNSHSHSNNSSSNLNNNHSNNDSSERSKSQTNKSDASPESNRRNCTSRPVSTQSNEMSPKSYLTSPSLAEATISDNESFSLQSSELTTPDTPLCGAYAPLLDFEESSVSNNTTPDFDVNDKTRKYSSETENLDKTMAKANLEFDKHKNIGKEYERFEEKIIRISSENICLELKNKYENVTSDMIKVEKIKSQEISPPKPEERKHKRNHQYENIPIVRPEIEPRKASVVQAVVLETSFDSKIQPEPKSPVNRDSIISIKYECISTESSSDSLINLNKTDENKLLLAVKSPNPSPVVEEFQPNWPDSSEIVQYESTENVESAENPDINVSNEARSNEQVNNEQEEMNADFDIIDPSDSNWFEEVASEIFNNVASNMEGKDLLTDDKADDSFPTDANLIEDNKSSANLEEGNLIEVNFKNLPQNDVKLPKEKIVEENATCDSNINDILSDHFEDEIPLQEVDLSKNEGENFVGDIVNKTSEILTEEEKKQNEIVESKSPYLETEIAGKPAFEETEKKLLETSFDESNDIETVLMTLSTSPKRTKKAETKASPKKKLSPQKSNSSGNVRQLLTKFEVSPTTEKNLLELKFDFHNYKKKESKPESKIVSDEENFSRVERKRNVEERPRTLERLSTKRRTEKEKLELPDTNLGKSKSGSQIDEKGTEINSKIGALLNSDLDLSDPQRRERIERYKEKRRTYLREKYHTDSFKGDKDDFLLKFKQKHVSKDSQDPKPKEVIEVVKRLPPFEKPARKHLPTKSQTSTSDKSVLEKRNPPFEKPARKNPTSKLIEPGSKDFYKRSFSMDNTGKKFDISSLPVSSRDQSNGKSGFSRLGFERRSAGDFRSPKTSPEKKNLSLDLSSPDKTHPTGKLSPELLVSYSPRKKLSQSQDSSSTGKSSTDSGISTDSNRTKSVDETRYSLNSGDKLPNEGCTTPTYCIKDMAALFERREESNSQVKTQKQYLSSV